MNYQKANSSLSLILFAGSSDYWNFSGKKDWFNQQHVRAIGSVIFEAVSGNFPIFWYYSEELLVLILISIFSLCPPGAFSLFSESLNPILQ